MSADVKKNTLDRVKKARKNVFMTIGKRDRVQFLQNKRQGGWKSRRVLEDVREDVCGCDSATCLPVVPMGVRLLSPHSGLPMVVLFLHDCVSQWWFPGSWERYAWTVKVERGWEKRYISKGKTENIQLQVLCSKCSKKR